MNLEKTPKGVVEKYKHTIAWSELVEEAVNDPNDMRVPEILFKKENEFLLKQYQAFKDLYPFLKEAQCFEVGEDIFNFAYESFDPDVVRDSDTPVPVDYYPCADVMYIAVEGVESHDHSYLLIKEGDVVIMNACSVKPDFNGMQHNLAMPITNLGSWDLKKNEVRINTKLSEKSIPHVISAAFGIVQIINTPRFITEQPAGTRHQRKQMKREIGKPVDGWHKITWNLNKPSVAQSLYEEALYKLPLHFVRGHWRKAKETDPKSMQRPKALNPEHRTMWWTRIEGFWRGHPANGIKKSYHAPKIKVQLN